jgi:hypothetical protein
VPPPMVVHDARLLSSAVQLPVSILRRRPGRTLNRRPFIPFAFTTKDLCSALLHLFVGGILRGPPRPLILYRWALVTFPPIGEWPSTITRLVGAVGFEPTASCSQGKRAAGLRYAPNMVAPVGFDPTTSRL